MIESIKQIINNVEAQNRFKVPGQPATYSEYNEGWSAACDSIKTFVNALELTNTGTNHRILRENLENLMELEDELQDLIGIYTSVTVISTDVIANQYIMLVECKL